MIIVWKKQNENRYPQLLNDTLKYLLKDKSKGVLSKIRRRLTRELILITIVSAQCNVLFVLVDLPYSLSRWVCFVIFNLISLWYVYCYFQAIYMLKLRYKEDLRTNMERIIKKLTLFRNRYRLISLPIIVLCIVMFAGSENLLQLVPWMVLEFLIWRSLLLPKLKVRFDDYIAYLENSLRNLQEFI